MTVLKPWISANNPTGDVPNEPNAENGYIAVQGVMPSQVNRAHHDDNCVSGKWGTYHAVLFPGGKP
jgi:hypothetical protein